jgi:hypothetical protein
MNDAIADSGRVQIVVWIISALSEALGPAGMTIFLQQFESGVSDYTKEKYEQPDTPLADLVAELRATE